MKKRFLTYFPQISNVNLHKDPIQIPLAITRVYSNIESLFFSFGDRSILDDLELGENDNLHFLIKKPWKRFNFIRFMIYLSYSAKSINYLYYYWFGEKENVKNILMLILYKTLNRKGIAIARLEYSTNLFQDTFPFITPKCVNDKFYNYVIKKTIKLIDILAIPDPPNLMNFKSKYNLRQFYRGKMLSIGNGYALPKKFKPLQYNQKKNIISIVGRLDDDWKGLSILLKALKDIDLNGWVVNCIGEFNKSQFIIKHPGLLESIMIKHSLSVNFIGFIQNRNRYYDLLSSSKIIVNVYSFDGYPLSLIESIALGNVPIVTSLPNYSYLTGYGKFGIIVPVNNSDELKKQLIDIVNSKYDLESMSNEAIKFAIKNLTWESIVKSMKL